MNKSKRRLGILIGILILLGICLLISFLVYLPSRAQTVLSRPLVLIHSPLNQDFVEVGQGILIHATARNKAGVTRMELWVDGILVDTQTPPEGDSANPLVLSTNWQAATAGKHILVVRAYAPNDVSGQATVQIEIVESTAAHTVAEGETLESIAETYGVGTDELVDSNPDLPAGGEPAPGDTLDIPAGGGDEADPAEPAGTEEEAPPAGEGTDSAPSPESHAPGDWAEVLDFFLDIDWGSLFAAGADSPRSLHVEILGFDVLGAYEDTNCYASLGGSPWDLSEVEGASHYFEWAGNQPLDLDIACVGIASGGTDSVDLGRIAMRIPPENWDGVRRTATSSGDGFSIEYRVSNSDDTGVEPLWLEPDMTPPTNLFLDERRQGLSWEYHPEPDEEEIYGFAVYLNGNLQWVEPYDGLIRNVSDLPPEWLHPPCGEQYIFTVTSIGDGFPDGPESFPALPPVIVETPEDECEVEVTITFYDLITYELGGDGDARHRSGDVGPVYGSFFANEQQATFDTGDLDDNWAVMGISHNTTYDLSVFAADYTRSWAGFPTLTTEVPEGETLQIGFQVMDEDSGRCRDSEDPGCDDLVCEGETFYTFDDNAYRVQEASITSSNGCCEVTFRIEPAGDSPIGAPDGSMPLPHLYVNKLFVDESAPGHLFVEVGNDGSATWTSQNLFGRLYYGGSSGADTLLAEDFRLEPGNTAILDTGYIAEHPLNFCIQLDPTNLFAESVEPHPVYCQDLPDLVIDDVDYDPTGSGRLRVTVRNNGAGTLENRTIALETRLLDGTPLYIAASMPEITLEPHQSRVIDLPYVPESALEQMSGGYMVIVNPDLIIEEENYDNNAFITERTTRIRFEPLEFFSGRNGESRLVCRAEAYFNVQLGHGSNEDDISWEQVRYPETGVLIYQVDNPLWCHGQMPGPWIPTFYMEVDVPQNENLYLRMQGWEVDDPGDNEYLGEIYQVYTAEENFGEGEYGWTDSINSTETYQRFQARWNIIIVEP